MFKRLPDCLNLLFFSPQNCCEIPSERIQFRRKQIGEREKFNEKQRLEMEEFQMEAQIRQVASSHSELRQELFNKELLSELRLYVVMAKLQLANF